MSVSRLKIDTTDRIASGNISLAVYAKQAADDIALIHDGAADYVYTVEDYRQSKADGPISIISEDMEKPGALVTQALEAPLATVRKRSWYPFDKYTFPVGVSGAVSTRAGDLMIAPQVLKVGMAEQHFEITNWVKTDSEGSSVVEFTVQRPFFIGWVSGWVGAFLLTSLLHLVTLSDLKDLVLKTAGYFGTMWAFRQLIVPSTIPIFPSVIDYFVLGLFGAD